MGVRTCFIISNQAGAPYVSIWKSYGNTSHLETCQFTCLELCVRLNINDGTYRFWAKCVLENAGIYMLFVAVDGGPIWNIIKVETAELLGDAKSVPLIVYQL